MTEKEFIKIINKETKEKGYCVLEKDLPEDFRAYDIELYNKEYEDIEICQLLEDIYNYNCYVLERKNASSITIVSKKYIDPLNIVSWAKDNKIIPENYKILNYIDGNELMEDFNTQKGISETKQKLVKHFCYNAGISATEYYKKLSDYHLLFKTTLIPYKGRYIESFDELNNTEEITRIEEKFSNENVKRFRIMIDGNEEIGFYTEKEKNHIFIFNFKSISADNIEMIEYLIDIYKLFN